MAAEPSDDMHSLGVIPQQGMIVAGEVDEILTFGGCSLALVLVLVRGTVCHK